MFHDLASRITPEEQREIEGLLLGQQFLTHIHDVMEERGMSRKDLAEKMGTSPSFLTQLFRGDRPLSDRNKALMARELGIKWEINALRSSKHYPKTKSMSAAAEPRTKYGGAKARKPTSRKR
jgi:ribosome-binding protein aMBF1 (putative translation factor)